MLDAGRSMGTSAADDSEMGAHARGAEQVARRARVASHSPHRDSSDEPPRASTAIGGSTGLLGAGLERPVGDHLDLLVENRERFRKLEAESQACC